MVKDKVVVICTSQCYMNDHPVDECLPYSCTLGLTLGYDSVHMGKAISGAIHNIHLYGYIYNRDEY